jgi:hypothetical protein
MLMHPSAVGLRPLSRRGWTVEGELCFDISEVMRVNSACYSEALPVKADGFNVEDKVVFGVHNIIKEK